MKFLSQDKRLTLTYSTPFTPEEEMGRRQLRGGDPEGRFIQFDGAGFYDSDTDPQLEGDDGLKRNVEDFILKHHMYGTTINVYDPGSEKVTMRADDIDAVVRAKVEEELAKRGVGVKLEVPEKDSDKAEQRREILAKARAAKKVKQGA